MKLISRLWRILLVASFLLLPTMLWSWGFVAHKWINREAIKLLPAPLQSFYHSVADSVVEKSIDPDLRRKRVPNEEFHHYIDIDHYGRYPFAELPRDYQTAVQKFSADTLLRYGDAPWHIARLTDSLAAAMRQGQIKTIIQLSADLGHYVADLHMPLHLTENYDGQMTNNRGIHARFEWHMIERFQDRIHLTPSAVDSIANPTEFAFEIILSSYVWSDNLLRADTRARDPRRLYQRREDFDDAYYEKLFALTQTVAEQQMSAAAQAVASYWYTAWLRAGRPRLMNNK
ncbi:MAG: hypothetical protein ONB44_08895 [candidate division KSB1 bacterium]|nr:hypothetical protein [candidate division KSB1 bacterium]MDZ7302248.1 hypothetical protein [candidate division KSB1 bacterium]MDZ7311354.1 hypothetical protein [candidate division KSB1 bacterium]